MTTVNTSAMYSPSQIGFKGKEKRVIPTIVKNLLEENRSKRIIPEELINDPTKPIKKVPTMVKNLLEENRGKRIVPEELLAEEMSMVGNLNKAVHSIQNAELLPPLKVRDASAAVKKSFEKDTNLASEMIEARLNRLETISKMPEVKKIKAEFANGSITQETYMQKLSEIMNKYLI